MDLNARAIELVLERRFAELGERFVDGFRRVGEHRLERLKQLQREVRERVRFRGAAAERSGGDRGQRAGQHRRAPDACRGQARRARDGFEQHAFERALAKLAEQQPDEEVLLLARGACEQIAQNRGPRRRRSRAGGGGETRERGIDVAQFQGRRAGGRHVVRGADDRRADAEAPLSRRAGQEADGDFDFIGREARQHVGQTADFLRAGRWSRPHLWRPRRESRDA